MCRIDRRRHARNAISHRVCQAIRYHPIHILDDGDILRDAKAQGEEAPWEAKAQAQREAKAKQTEADNKNLEAAISGLGGSGKATVTQIAEILGTCEKTVRSRIKKHGLYQISKGLILARTEL